MSAQTYFQHPLYPLAMQHLQEGNWRAGLDDVERLIKLFPLEQELRSLRNEFNFKARLDSSGVLDRAVERRRTVQRLVLRVGLVLTITSIAYFTIRTSWQWMGQQVQIAQERVAQEIQIASMNAMRRDAEAFLYAGRLEDAELLLFEMAQIDPAYAGLPELSAQLAVALELSNQYDEAMQAIERSDWVYAQSLLQGLETAAPNYRDVSIQLAYIERQTLLGNLLNAGDAAFARGDWQEAVSAFESVRSLHPQYDPAVVEGSLYQSYVNAGRAVLIGQEDSLAALEQAEGYFRKALALRPQDADIKRERELAGLYLTSQDDFDQGHWTDVIEALEIVIGVDPNYAQGTARQTLFDAYAARGEYQMSVHYYDGALIDFERAASLAEQDSGAVLRLYEAHLKVAEAHGATGNFEAAVLHYRAAVELGNLAGRAGEGSAGMLSALQEAEVYAARGNFGVAFERYARAVRLANDSQENKIHVVQEGEYLTLLASRYGSTVRAIVLANGIENSNLIFPGQELVIPVLP